MSKILKEQSDEAAVITILTAQLNRLVRLYQIPNSSETRNIELADWVYENYKWESFDMVYSVLKNPPATTEPNWRLTPDTIRQWMSEAMEKQAAARELDHDKAKNSNKKFEPEEGLDELYRQIRSRALSDYETKEEMRKIEAEKRRIRYSPVDFKALQKRDEQAGERNESV